MISEGSFNTEDWSNAAENSALITWINYIFTYIHIENIVILNSKNIWQYCYFLLYFWSNICNLGEHKRLKKFYWHKTFGQYLNSVCKSRQSMSTPEVALTENVSIIDGSFFSSDGKICYFDRLHWSLFHTCSVCSVYACRVHYVCCAEAAQTHCAFTQDAFAVRSWSAAVYHKHSIYPSFWFQIQTLLAYTESTFSALWSSFITAQLHNLLYTYSHLTSIYINNILNAFGYRCVYYVVQASGNKFKHSI